MFLPFLRHHRAFQFYRFGHGVILTKQRDALHVLIHHMVSDAFGCFPIGFLNVGVRVNEIVAVVSEPDLAQVIAG